LEVILADPIHRKTLRLYADSLFCAESLLFWERVIDYRKSVEQEPTVAPGLAQNIWNNFLATKSEMQLSVREGVREDIKEALDSGNVGPGIFDVAQREAFSTMQFSLYPA
jgi:hypothetical protein